LVAVLLALTGIDDQRELPPRIRPVVITDEPLLVEDHPHQVFAEQVPDKVTRDALRRLSDWLGHDEDQGDEASS
jgi:hypothetical protein